MRPEAKLNKAGTDLPLGSWQRLHVATLCLPVLTTLPQIAIVGLVLSYTIGLRSALVIGFWLMLVPSIVYHVFRFFTFEYRLSSADIFLREGILWRQERRIPVSRIHDMEIQQGPLHQLFGLAKLQIKTAGSEEREAVLDVISKNSAAELKRAVAARQGREISPPGLESAPASRPKVLAELTAIDLILGAVTSRMAATLFAFIGVLVYFQVMVAIGSRWIEEVVPPVDPFPWTRFPMPGRGTILEPLFRFFWGDTFGKSTAIIILGFLFFLVRYISRYARYRLIQDGTVLTRSRGLFRVQTTTVPGEHVQALKIEEGLIRRWFRLADMWMDTGGDRAKGGDDKKREPFVPLLGRPRAFQLTASILQDLRDPEPHLRRVSRKAVMRGARKFWLAIAWVMLLTALPLGWLALIWIPAFPLAYFLNLQWYRNRGYWTDGRHLISRKGWFNRETLYLPVTNIQNVSLIRNPFDRRLGLATISVDTAGQSNTGGGPTIRNLPMEDAKRLQEMLIDQRPLERHWA
jgi:putative membrane protein